VLGAVALTVYALLRRFRPPPESVARPLQQRRMAGNLDTDRSQEVLALLTALCTERGVVMVLATHDPQAASFATHVRTLRDGRLCEEASSLPTAPAARS
jgi:predicted ABC-type transport system involved in lysophospholipase L1 biosynthesis ATPase subunit